MKRIPMTSEGFNTLNEDLKQLKTVERPAIIQAITEARAHGDLSENAEYHAAKERQSFVEGRVAEIEDRLARAEVIDTSRLTGERVKFGASVTILDEEAETQSIYKIVGEDEASVADGKISVSSPIARALIGKEEGEVVEVTAPGGARSYEILSIAWL